MMQQSARLMRVVTPNGLLGDWVELDNKFEAFRLFQYADHELRSPVARTNPLQVIPGASVGNRFRSIWILEGAGHIAGLNSSLSGRGLLTEGDAATLPDTAMVPLHAGMGTAFAEKLLGGLASSPSMPDIDRTIRQFADVCRANCRPGWDDATMEPLGLVVRCLYPKLIPAVSIAMEGVSPELRNLFWHGVGRGLYFVPTNFLPLPGARERMLKNAAVEAGDAEARRNILSGLIWAVTLVNLPHPSIIRSVAALCSEMKIRDEFTNGLLSALLAWRHMAPEDLRHIGTYTSALPGNATEATLWKEWIEIPAHDALRDVYPGLEARNRIPALYTYRTYEELRRLGAPVAAGSCA